MKTHNLKKIAATSLAAAMLLLTTACGSGTDSTSSAGSTAGSAADSKATVVVATSGVSNPFSYQKDGQLTGYDVEVVKAIFDGLPQYDLQIEVIEFEGILNGLDNGRYQLGINNFSYNKERAEKYDFSLPIIENANIFVVRSDDNALTSIAELGGYKAVTEVGNSGATILENYNTEHPDDPCEIVYTEENFVKQFEQIEAGMYDVRIISRVSAESAIAEHGFTNLKVVPFANEDSDPGSYILFSKTAADTELQEQVNQRIREMYNDGTLLKISQEQLGGDYTPAADLMK